MERVGRLLCLALVLSLPLVLVAVLVLQVRQAAGSLPATGPRHTIVPGRDPGTRSTHRTCTSRVRNTLLMTTPIAAVPAGTAAPAVLGLTATSAQLALLDTVTVAATLYNGAPRLAPPS